MKTGIELIAEERKRQIDEEKWTPEHDDKHTRGELAQAADSYRIYTDMLLKYGSKLPPCFIPKQWPWDRCWWKPSSDPVRNLVKAGALYQAQADFCRRKNRMDEVEVAEGFCVRFIAEKIDQLQKERAASVPASDDPHAAAVFDLHRHRQNLP